MSENFQRQVGDFIEVVYRIRGFRLDLQLSGQPVMEAVHVDIDPAIDAIVRTELRISQRMVVDLRELMSAAPPVEGENLFVTFRAGSANYQGGNAAEFGIHMTRLNLTPEIRSVLEAGIFVPGAAISDACQLFVFLKASNGDISLAKTGIITGLDREGRLVSYLTFQVDPNLAAVQLNPPSRMAESDPKVMIYVFLTLSAFMAVNQGEAPLHRLEDGTIAIG